MQINELSTKLHLKYLKVLNLYRFIRQSAFIEAYCVASHNEKVVAIKLVDCNEHEKLINWTKEILKKYALFELLDFRQLRDIAQDRGIYNYSLMSKIDLINALTKSNKGSKHENNGTQRRDERAADEIRQDANRNI